MDNESKINLFMTILAYTSATYTPKEVIELYQFAKKEGFGVKFALALAPAPEEEEEAEAEI